MTFPAILPSPIKFVFFNVFCNFFSHIVLPIKFVVFANIFAYICRRDVENDRVRILKIKFKKSAAIKAHAHPDHLAFVTAPGTLKVSPAEGDPVDFTLEVGKAMMIDAGVHAAKATKGAPEAVIFEFKGPAAAAPTEPTK